MMELLYSKHLSFWFSLVVIVIINIFLCPSFIDGEPRGLHVLPAPSREELLAHLSPNNGSSAEVSSKSGDMLTTMTPSEDGFESGRSIVSSLSQQASNIGKGFLDFLRGNPLSGPRRPVPYPGPQMLRPHPPIPPRYRPGQPVSYMTLMSDQVEKDRVGGSGGNGQEAVFTPEKFEGGFLPSKKLLFQGSSGLLHEVVSPSATSSVAINSSSVVLPTPKAPCDFYTDSLCIESHPYPIGQMRQMIRMDLSNVRKMMADVSEQNANVLIDGLTLQEELLYSYEHYYGREDNNTHSYRDYAADGGFVCPSDIKYVRLEKGRTAYGIWKYIVNFDGFTQTIRLEKCLKPYSRCSYVFSYLNSECIQVYNYQRLLAWDLDQGFHVDVFKIPTSCSCHIRSSSSNKRVSVTTSTSIPSIKSSPSNSKLSRKKSSDAIEMLPEKSYVTENPAPIIMSQTSQPLQIVEEKVEQEEEEESSSDSILTPAVQQTETPLRKHLHHLHTKPSRFEISEAQTGQNLQLNNLNIQTTDMSGPQIPIVLPFEQQRIPNFRMGSSQHINNNNNNNNWHSNMRNNFPLIDERISQVDRRRPSSSDLMSNSKRYHGMSYQVSGGGGTSSSDSAQVHGHFRQRAISEGLSTEQPYNSNIRRVNYNMNPVSEFMHNWKG